MHPGNGAASNYMYGQAPGQSPYYAGAVNNGSSAAGGGGDGGGLRKRTTAAVSNARASDNGSSSGGGGSMFQKSAVVRNMDFMFPKIDNEFVVQTNHGGFMTIIAYVLIAVLILAETITWMNQNASQSEHIVIDTTLGKRMRVNMNITFPALACEDLHVDAMDVAGDSQINVEETLRKKQLHLDGRALSKEEIVVQTNMHHQKQQEKDDIIKKGIPDDYCGPCYGATSPEGNGDCCQTCDQVVAAYKNKKWRTDIVMLTSEQCIREGRDKEEPKLIKKGEGCNLSGYMTVNRVAGNFHIAMGEGVERDGRHIHTFVPEDAPNFNASHIIHELTFGPIPTDTGKRDRELRDEFSPLSKVNKIVTEQHGSTGLFQYFIKVVPTNYIDIDPKDQELSPSNTNKGTTLFETNRYFFTERFRPLIEDEDVLEEVALSSASSSGAALAEKAAAKDKDEDKDEDEEKEEEGDDVAAMERKLEEDQKKEDEEEDERTKSVHAGGSKFHPSGKNHHHKIQHAVLPGVFFIYEIYPFAVQISNNQVPFTHLLIRLMATIGGVLTIVRWADTFLYEQNERRRKANRRR